MGELVLARFAAVFVDRHVRIPWGLAKPYHAADRLGFNSHAVFFNGLKLPTVGMVCNHRVRRPPRGVERRH